MNDQFKLTRFVTRHGKRIRVEALDTGHDPKPRRKAFKASFVTVPRWWTEVLRQTKRVSTLQLAMVILDEAFKRKHMGGEVVLSSETTGMPRNTRMKAVNELVKLGIIEIEQNGKQATKVSYIYYDKKEEE